MFLCILKYHYRRSDGKPRWRCCTGLTTQHNRSPIPKGRFRYLRIAANREEATGKVGSTQLVHSSPLSSPQIPFPCPCPPLPGSRVSTNACTEDDLLLCPPGPLSQDWYSMASSVAIHSILSHCLDISLHHVPQHVLTLPDKNPYPRERGCCIT